jgi:hypothetical protein
MKRNLFWNNSSTNYQLRLIEKHLQRVHNLMSVPNVSRVTQHPVSDSEDDDYYDDEIMSENSQESNEIITYSDTAFAGEKKVTTTQVDSLIEV